MATTRFIFLAGLLVALLAGSVGVSASGVGSPTATPPVQLQNGVPPLAEGLASITPAMLRSPMLLALVVVLAFQLLFRPLVEFVRAGVGLLVFKEKPPEVWEQRGFVYSVVIYGIGLFLGLWLEGIGVALAVPCWLNALFVLALSHGEYEGIKNLLSLIGVDVQKIALPGWRWA